MPQEFLASFGVQIDEAGVNRLQAVLAQNREMAEKVSEAFGKAYESIQNFLGISSGNTDEAGRTVHPASPLDDIEGYIEEEEELTRTQTATEEAILREIGLLNDRTNRGYILDSFVYNAAGAAAHHFTLTGPSREEYGLTGDNPTVADRDRYRQFYKEAYGLFSDAKDEAFHIMEEALAAETAGLDTTAYTERIVESLRQPLEQIRELYDSYGFDYDDPRSLIETDFTEANEELDAFLKKTSEPVPLKGDTSEMLSAARSALSYIRNLFASASATMRVNVEIATSGKSGSSGTPGLSTTSDLLSSAPTISAPVVSGNSSTSVQAPVTINVSSSGASAEAIGQSVYNTAEQYLLRTLQGATPG